MFFKKEKIEQNSFEGLYSPLDELIAQKKYLPYIKSKHNHITSYQAGDIRSAFKGRGMELEEVRLYGYGDDVRDIDWRVTARKGETYTKVFAEEKDREVYVILDLSPYMLFGTKNELKSVSACKLAALLGWQSLVNKDRFGLLLFDGIKNRFFKPQNNIKSFMAILKSVSETSQAILQNKDKTKTNLLESLEFLQFSIKSKAVIFLISDFNSLNEEELKAIAMLAQKNRMYCCNIYDVVEELPPENGEYMAQYNGEKLIFNTSSDAFKDAYYQYFAKKRKDLEIFCKRFGCFYLNIRTDRPIYKQLKIL